MAYNEIPPGGSSRYRQSRFDCCNKSDKEQCRFICDKAMSGPYDHSEQVEALFEACGDPLKDDTWLCFMKQSSGNITPLGELTAIQCCRKAVYTECRNRCLGLYKNWVNTDLWDEFNQKCRYNPEEEQMVNCILDVSEPCTLGCDHLTFCDNMNNRPLEMFRTCSAQYDNGAEHDYNVWAETGFIQTPLINITVQNITTCHPQDWKAVACILQTKPCHQKSHSNTICKGVCMRLLDACLDKVRSHRTVEEICAILAPNDDPEYCLDLEHYTKPGMDESRSQLNHPCQPHPCRIDQQCALNRNCPNGVSTCTPFICQDSCNIGATRDFRVELGTWVRIPVYDDSLCYKVCTCDSTRKLSRCRNLDCPDPVDCKIGTMYYTHGSQFTWDCNTCVCYSGHVTCTKRDCSGYTAVSSLLHTGGNKLKLPGQCSLLFSPVCGPNGARYPNPCVARQFVMKESLYHYTLCDQLDVCRNSPCPENKVCRAAPQVCLDSNIHNKMACPQYTCESPTINCEGESLEPVCDTKNVQHPHMCSLLQHQRTLAHKGYCVGSCNITEGPVCGANGRTYSSRCAADGDFMIMDYPGPCQPPSDTDFSKGYFCSSDVKCLPLPEGCDGLRLPDMCCPVCGALLSVLPSQILVQINELYLADTDKLTVFTLCEKISRLLSLSECKVACSLGLYGDVNVVIATTVASPTWIHIEACNNEALRFQKFIEFRNVRIDSDLVLSTILGGTVTPVNATRDSTNSSGRLSPASQIFILFIFLCRIIAPS